MSPPCGFMQREVPSMEGIPTTTDKPTKKRKLTTKKQKTTHDQPETNVSFDLLGITIQGSVRMGGSYKKRKPPLGTKQNPHQKVPPDKEQRVTGHFYMYKNKLRLYKYSQFHKCCEHPYCKTVGPSFGINGSKPSHCGIHAMDGMVNLKKKRCKYPGCKIMACFACKGKKPECCFTHKLDGMVNVNDKRRCKYPGCNIHPRFANEGERPIYCATHKMDGMENVVDKRCEHPDCKIQACFASEGKKPSRCGIHKLDGMINIYARRCEHPDCKIQASYGNEGERPTHCALHKLDGMEDVHNKTKRCLYSGCEILASFGNEGESATHCNTHKLDGMEDVLNKRKVCQYLGCMIRSCYGNEGESPTRCITHKLDGMENVVSKRCLTCPMIVGTTTKYKGHCAACWQAQGNKPKKSPPMKERAVRDRLEKSFPEMFTYNKTIGPSKKRPDANGRNAFGEALGVECDENQHRTYSCENNRNMQLILDQGINRISIRFNPDAYTDKEGKNHPSCWYIDNRGIWRVKKKRKKEWKERLGRLCETVECWLTHESGMEFREIKLFYDGFDPN